MNDEISVNSHIRNVNEWNHFESFPDDNRDILMKCENFDVPPWTGFHNGERYVSYETRLPIQVSHWKYIE